MQPKVHIWIRDRWAMSDKGGLNIIKARYALTQFYENLEDIDRDLHIQIWIHG
jgi:hypothetical protein